MIFQFKESKNLAAAYGLAVTGTMAITGIMMTAIFYIKVRSSNRQLQLIVQL